MVVEHKHRSASRARFSSSPSRSSPPSISTITTWPRCIAFLQRYGLTKEVKVNIEVNHATLAGLDFEHEIAAARAFGIFGSIDINRGDPRNGWDTDQFPNNAQELVPSWCNWWRTRASPPAASTSMPSCAASRWIRNDLYLAHIGGIDTIARALLAAADVVWPTFLTVAGQYF
jgi:xylose isomerase